MEHSTSSLQELYSRLSIEEEEIGGVILGNEARAQRKESFVLIGRFLTDKNINFNAMQNVLASVWRPKEGVEIHDIGEMRYSFVFYHPMDLQKVLEGGPWSFEQGMLIYKQISDDEDPKEVTLNEVDIWVQVYDILKGFVSESILQSVGNSIGNFVKSDPANFNGGWKTYVRIRVTMNVLKPLKRRMRIKREGGQWSWINFKYERLSTFCFVCGILGQSERDCSVVYENPDKNVERAYDTWLRAPGRNSKTTAGSRWLRNGEWKSENGKSIPATTRKEDARGGAKFQGYDSAVTVNQGDNGTITVTTRNQEEKDKGRENLNDNEEGNIYGDNVVILDPKRRRMEIENTTKDNGPINMQTDGLGESEQTNSNRSPKNLNVVGPGT